MPTYTTVYRDGSSTAQTTPHETAAEFALCHFGTDLATVASLGATITSDAEVAVEPAKKPAKK